MKNIVIIGDSYAAAGRKESNVFSEINLYFITNPYSDSCEYIAWTDLIADHYGYKTKSFAYGGKSWWFSYSKFEQWKHQNPEQWELTDLVIFAHTDYSRLNSSDTNVPNMPTDTVSFYKSSDIGTAIKMWHAYLYDREFQRWAQQQFFKSLSDFGKDKKIIHMCMMRHGDRDELGYDTINNGVVVLDSLFDISSGEFKNGCFPDNFMDKRFCHFSPQNHVVLANELINIVDNYNPGPVSFRPNMFHKAFIQ